MSTKTALVTIAKDVEIAAEDALHFVQKTTTEIPQVAGALGVLLGATAKAISAVESAANSPIQVLSLSFDEQVFADLKAVWPDLVKFAATLGIKL